MPKRGLCEPSEQDEYRLNLTEDREVPDPVALLMERMLLGGGPDQRFYDDVDRCAAFFDENPAARMVYICRIKRSAMSAILADRVSPELWGIAEPSLMRTPSAKTNTASKDRDTKYLEEMIFRLTDRVDHLESLVLNRQAKPQVATKSSTGKILKTVVTRSGVTHKKRG